MNRVVYSDLYAFNFLSNVVIAPDGKHAVFVKSNASEEKNGYTSELWLMDLPGGAHRRLTTGGDERGTFWLDERTVAFSTGRGRKPDQKSSIWYKIAIDGGEAEPFLEIEDKISNIMPLGGGRYAVVSPQNCEGKPEEQPNRALEGRDLVVFDEIPFWFNGQGVKNKIRSTLMIYDETTRTLTAVSPKYASVGSVQLSPDGKTIAYTATEYTDVMPRESGLYLYEIGGETKTIVPQQHASIGSPYFMGDGRLFYTATTFEFSGRNPRFFVYDIATGEAKALPFVDASPHGGVGTDCNYGGGNDMKYVDGWLYFVQTSWGNAHLVRMDAEGNIEKVSTAPGTLTCFDIFENTVLMAAMRGTDLIELYRLDLITGEEVRLTGFNAGYMNSHSVIQPEHFTFINSAGVELEGYVLKPLGYEPGKKYPGILEMHGGPKAVFGGVLHHEMQCFANQGYFVFYTNPRGSDGRGEDFANITERLGEIDYDDFMEFTDEVLRRYADIDEDRIGICGGSYGGFMCNWMIGHTDRFAAAASQRSISNYLTKALCTDIGYSHNMAQLGTDPWHDFDTVWEHSPLKCAPMAKTPTLFIQSDEDYRCWMSDAISMFTALKMNGVDARIALFHGENHELSRSGKPKNRISRLSEIGDWFEKYLKQKR